MIRLTLLKRWACAAAAIVSAAALSSCSASEESIPVGRDIGEPGDLVSVEPLERDGGGGVGLTAYRLIYRTSSIQGPEAEPVEVSGLLLVPDEIASDAVTSYQHSSAVSREDVPTVAGTPHREAAQQLARSGRVVVAADYLGLGASEGLHPWLDADTEASAAADLLLALPDALAELDLAAPTKVDLVGFSQGAHATMALARRLGSGPSAFDVRSIIGIGGPYRLDAVDVPALVSGESDPMVRSLALARLVDTAAALGHDTAGMFASGVAEEVRDLFDGTHTDVEVVTSLPEDPRGLFSDEGWAALLDPEGVFGRWLAATSTVCGGWTAEVPVTLLHARGDTSALPANSELCRDQLSASGVTVTLEDLGDLEHIPSGEAGTFRAIEILRQADGAVSGP